MDVHISKYPIGNSTTLEVVIGGNTPQVDLIRLATVSVKLFAIEAARNKLRLAFAQAPEIVSAIARVSQELPDQLANGLYAIVVQLQFAGQEGNTLGVLPQSIPTAYFLVSDGTLASPADVHAALQQREQERLAYLNAAIRTNASATEHSNHFSVHVFCVGSLIHARKDLEGYAVIPLNQSFNYSYMLNPINAFEMHSTQTTVQFSQRIQELYERDTPLFVIEFKDVIAINYEDAENYCWQLADNINMILTMEKGYRPKVFATISRKHNRSEIRQVIYHEGYSGNLVPSFSPTEIADTIDFKLPILMRNPWINLLYQSYTEALSEKNLDFAYLKIWTLLELIADTRVDRACDIKDPDGNVIKWENGKPVTTNYKLGKVYQLLFCGELFQSRQSAEGTSYIFENHTRCSVNDGEVLYTLWDTARALYEIRNATAHEGKFDATGASSDNPRKRIAAELYSLPHRAFWYYVRETVRYVVEKEMRIAAKVS